MATPICANDAVDIDSTTSANNSVGNKADNNLPMVRVCMVIPLAGHPSFTRYYCYRRGLRGLNGKDCLTLKWIVSALSQVWATASQRPAPDES